MHDDTKNKVNLPLEAGSGPAWQMEVPEMSSNHVQGKVISSCQDTERTASHTNTYVYASNWLIYQLKALHKADRGLLLGLLCLCHLRSILRKPEELKADHRPAYRVQDNSTTTAAVCDRFCIPCRDNLKAAHVNGVQIPIW